MPSYFVPPFFVKFFIGLERLLDKIGLILLSSITINSLLQTLFNTIPNAVSPFASRDYSIKIHSN